MSSEILGKSLRWAILLSLVVSLLVVLVSLAHPGKALADGPYNVQQFQITDGLTTSPAISGHTVIYQFGFDRETSFWGYDLDSGQRFPLTLFPWPEAYIQAGPVVAGNFVAWVERGRGGYDVVMGYDLRQRVPFEISRLEVDKESTRIAISPGWVIWVEQPSIGPGMPYSLRAYDLQRKIILPIYEGPRGLFPGRVCISGDVVVWNEFKPLAKAIELPTSRLLAYDLGAKCTIVIAPQVELTGLAVSGHMVVWSGDSGKWDIYGYDLDSQRRFLISSSAKGYGPAIWGDFVVWEDYRNSIADPLGRQLNADIYAYDLRSKKEIPLTTAPGSQLRPAISGHLVVWTDNRNGNWDIYGYDLDMGREFPIATGSTDQSEPRVFDGVVLWLDFGHYAGPPPPSGGGMLYGARILYTPDYAIPHGHFYTQANGFPPGASPEGYAISDANDIPFWAEFQRLGGVPLLGYPASRRFLWDGFASQVTQKQVLQWRPGAKQVYFVNVFDELSKAGKDDWLLAYRQVPRPLTWAWSGDAGLPWDEVVKRHLALLDLNPVIKARYFADPDPIAHFGLPMGYGEYDNVFVLRGQRAVLQQWKVDVPWGRAGQVTVANGGDIAKEAGLIPREATTPEAPHN